MLTLLALAVFCPSLPLKSGAETFPSLSELVAYYSRCISPTLGLRLMIPGVAAEAVAEQPTSPYFKVASSVTKAKHVRTPIKQRGAAASSGGAAAGAVLSLTPYVNSDSEDDEEDPDATYGTALAPVDDAGNDSDVSF